MSDAKTNFAEALVLQWLLTSLPTTRPSSLYVALHTGDPSENGNQDEVSAEGYARREINFSVALQTATNSGVVTFGPAQENWGTISHFSIWDAETGGNPYYKGELSNSRVVLTGDRVTFDIGALSISET